MYLCYIDESETSQIPGNTSHFILAGLCVPIEQWKDCDRQIQAIKKRYSIENAEIHTAWMMRKYKEQQSVSDFDSLDYSRRRAEVTRARNAELLRLQKQSKSKPYNQTKKNFKQTEPYIHLTLGERRNFVHEVAQCVGGWGSSRLFAECVDKIHFEPSLHTYNVDEFAFDQIVSRFEAFLQVTGAEEQNFGLLIHDNNQTVEKKHTELMKAFYEKGTLWRKINNIIETPLFVDSELTSMVQLADLCSYALRRYLENGEASLFSPIFKRADRKDGVVVGARHFTRQPCTCKICVAHNRS